MSEGADGSLGAFKLRWQNDQGDAVTEEFAMYFRDKAGGMSKNPPFLTHWLVSEVACCQVPKSDRDIRNAAYEELWDAANRLLANESTRFKHPNGIIHLSAADFRTPDELP